MRTSDGLFRLILSLKNKEKAGFRQFAGQDSGDINYLRLFDAINSYGTLSEIDDTLIMKALNYTGRNTYYVSKNYLFELIMKSLCLSHAGSSQDDIIRNRLLCIKILYEKTLFNKALELLRKVKKLSIDTENYMKLLEVLKWEKNLVIEGTVKGNKENLLKQLSEEEDHTLKCIGNISSYRLLSFKFNSFVKGLHGKNKKELSAGLKFFTSHPLLKNEKSAQTLASKVTRLEVTASIDRLMNNNEEVYHKRKKMIALLESKPLFWKENLTNYVISLYNLTGSCFELEYLDEMLVYIKRLQEISIKYSKTLAANTKMLIDIGTSRHELSRSLKLGEYSNAALNSLLLARLVKKYNNVLTESERSESLLLAIQGLFLNKDIDGSMKLINIVNSYNSEKLGNESFIMAKLIQILILFKNGEYETADYQALSLLKALNRLEKTESTIAKEIRMIKEVLGVIRKSEDEKILKSQLRETMKKYGQISNKNFCLTFLNHWLNSADKN